MDFDHETVAAAVVITSYNLDVHLTPDSAQIAVHARLTVRNTSALPLKILPLSISSALHWESISINGHKLPVTDWKQAQLETDADHTGAVSEAQISLAAAPLAPAATLDISAFYSGTIEPSAARLTRIGAPVDQASASDWDRISPDFIGLRGFGNVLWYPSVAPPLFLGDGAKLFQFVGLTRQRERESTFAARFTIQFTGDAPKSLILNGLSRDFTVAGDTATVDFSPQKLAFHTPNLFITGAENFPQPNLPIALSTTSSDHANALAAATNHALPLVNSWLGDPPVLTVIDLPESGDQPFEDQGVLAISIPSVEGKDLDRQLVHAIARAATATKPAWMSDGLANFLDLLWLEQASGRAAALAEIDAHTPALALAVSSQTIPNQSLADATDPLFYRILAADAWWMLRDSAGPTPLRHALTQLSPNQSLADAVAAMRKPLEQATNRDFKWFFDDWLLHPAGLPDLAILTVLPRELDGGQYLVSIEVANDGSASAEVPVTLSSGPVSITQRLLVPARAHATTRIVINGLPTKVQVNDGSVPEMRTTEHSQLIHITAN